MYITWSGHTGAQNGRADKHAKCRCQSFPTAASTSQQDKDLYEHSPSKTEREAPRVLFRTLRHIGEVYYEVVPDGDYQPSRRQLHPKVVQVVVLKPHIGRQ